MTLAGKFTDVLPDGQVAHLGGHVHVDSISTHAPPGAIIVPDAHLLFTGDFKRSGVDLILSGDGRELVLHDYFKGEKRAPLASSDGAHLTGDLVNALSGHVQLAQADGTPSVAQVIGHVTKLVGTATAIRNGVSIILNNGDNVNKGDVVQSGSDSTLGITFIDGSVFGLASNAKMVLNEMIYDPNGSSNSSLISLVQGTISFVAGATAKKGDMKVDTPVATMGIRGTAVLVEIDFVVQGQGGAPPAKFQVLVEPDGTTGSYILFDKTTLTPIATVNQAGTQTIVNGQGGVNFLSSVQLSPDAQKIISDVFALKFTDLINPKTNQQFTDTIVPVTEFVKTSSGEIVPVTLKFTQVADNTGPSTTTNAKGTDHIPGPPDVVTTNAAFTERAGLTGSATPDTLTGEIRYADINPGDTPTARADFNTFKYENAHHDDVTGSLTSEQIAAIIAVEVPLTVAQDPNGINHGVATWTYDVPDGAFDFLAVGETLTLTYLARVDNNFAANNETTFKTFTITITGTNDVPTVATSGGTVTERIGTGSAAIDSISGTVTFTDADLTDRPVVSASLSTSEPFRYLDAQGHNVTPALTAEQLAAIAAVEVPLSVVQGAGNSHNGSATWTYAVADHAFDFIAKGETLILNYVIQVSDGHGGTVSTPVSISINGADVTVVGTNDVPTIATTNDAFVEQTNESQPNPTGSTTADTAAGTITFTDVDLTDRPVVSTAYTSYTYSSASHNPLTLTAQQLTDVAVALGVTQTSGNANNGSAGWNYNVADGKFDFLAVGEILTLTYTATVDDGHGGVITKPFTITVTGTNDTATIATTNDAFVELTNETQPNPTGSTTSDTASGAITFADVDLTDRPVVSTAYTSYTYSSASHNPLTLTAQQLTDVAVALGVTQTSGNTNNGTAGWTYNVADGKFDFLAVNEVLTLTYTATVDDSHGGVITKPFTITITGTNDTATIATTSAAFTEMPGTANAALDHAGGTISFTDADLSDRPVVTTQFSNYTYKTAGGIANLTLTPEQAADLGASLSLTPVGGNTNSGSVNWSYDVADNKFDFLAAGEILTLSYLAKVNDTHGGVITKPITVTITGTNDAPTVAAVDAGTLADSAINDSFGNLVGTLVGYDPDHDGTASLSYSALDLTNHPMNSAIAGQYGSLTVNVDGTWNYVANAAVVNALHAGSYTETFTLQTTDVHNAVGTAVLTVHVNGANDTPTLANVAAGKLTDGAANDSFNDLTGVLVGNDRDSGETATLQYAALDADAPVHSAVTGLYGSLTVNADGTWTYVPNAAVINALHAGSHTDTFEVQTTDVHGASATAVLTVDVTGANDTPTLSAVNAGTLVDTAAYDSFGNLTGTLVGADLDSGETTSLHYAALDASNSVVATVIGNYGSLTVNADGTYSYVADAVAINALPAGVFADTFTVQAEDVNGAVGTAVLTVDVIGATDAPSIVGETDAPALAAMVIPGASSRVLAQGVNTNSLGLNTETFDDQPASSDGVGHGSFHSTTLDAEFSGTGSAGIVSGSHSGVAAAPFFGPFPGGSDATNYLSVGGGGTETITFGTEKNVFGLYWGSVDSYNTVSFYDGLKLVASYSGADIAPLFSDGNQGSFSSNGYVEFSGLGQFNKVTLTSTQNAFEIDNISAGNIAKPHSALAAPITGTLSVHDSDIGDTLTASITGNGTVEFVGADGSTHLPDGADVAALVDAQDVTFDSVQSHGGTDVLHWAYSPTEPDLDFLRAGDVLKIKFVAQVNDGQGNTGSEPLTVTLVGADSATNTSAFSVVVGTSGNDTFDNVGGNVTVFGGGGMDRFIFKAGFGNATIADFDVNKDTIDISQTLFDQIADILASAHPTNSDHDTIITDAAHNTILLKGVAVGQLHDSNFHLI